MSFYRSKYSKLYSPSLAGLRDNPQAEKEALANSSTMKTVGSMLPMLGTGAGMAIGAAAGGAGGAKIGGDIGGAFGQMGGAAMQSGGDQMLDSERYNSARRQALLELMRSFR